MLPRSHQWEEVSVENHNKEVKSFEVTEVQVFNFLEFDVGAVRLVFCSEFMCVSGLGCVWVCVCVCDLRGVPPSGY